VSAARFGAAAGGWYLLHQVGAFPLDGVTVVVGYPLVPWAALMAAGFGAGPVFELPAPDRRRLLWQAGVVLVVAFVAIRLMNGYGDPAPWRPEPSPLYTVLSFLSTTKYPPSLLFLLMTLGPVLLALAAFENSVPRGLRFLIVFGRVPLFFFVAHFYLAHAAAAGLALLRHGHAAWSFLFHPLPSMGGPADAFPSDFGYDLWMAYAVWMLVVAALYPACRRIAVLKAEGTHPWLSYF